MRTRPWHRWRLLRRASQFSFLVLFLTLLFLSTLEVPLGLFGTLFLRLDPLAGLSAMLAARRLLASFLPALGLVLLTLAMGRLWCGWLCPLGTLLEWISPHRARRALSPNWRWVKYGVLLALLVSALWSVQSLILLDPLPLLERGMVGLLQPALDLLGSVGGWGAGHFRAADLWPIVLLVAALALNVVAPLFWCHALCPLGALLGLLARPAWLRREVGSTCSDCGACARRCSVGAIQGSTWENDPGECVLCLNCAQVCPEEALDWRWRVPSRKGPAFSPSRRSLLVSLGAGLLVGGLLRLERFSRSRYPYLLRPPGAEEEGLLARCIRCGACISVCPTGGLRPALFSAGIEGLWTPLLLPRQGYCRYTCNACGQACPSEAIPPLPLAEKQVQIVGIARVEPARCLTWTENQLCTVCRDTCPVPGPAVEMVPEEAISELGERIRVDRPHVVDDLCIGCGICEYNCPVEGESAIRVLVLHQDLWGIANTPHPPSSQRPTTKSPG